MLHPPPKAQHLILLTTSYELGIFIPSFLQMRKLRQGKLGNLPWVTQPVGGIAGFKPRQPAAGVLAHIVMGHIQGPYQ